MKRKKNELVKVLEDGVSALRRSERSFVKKRLEAEYGGKIILVSTWIRKHFPKSQQIFFRKIYARFTYAMDVSKTGSLLFGYRKQ
jgi:hypothetical protein